MHIDWKPLDAELPEGDEWVLLFHPGHHTDPDFPGLSVTTSNPDYARGPFAAQSGYSHWARIPYPLPLPDRKD